LKIFPKIEIFTKKPNLEKKSKWKRNWKFRLKDEILSRNFGQFYSQKFNFRSKSFSSKINLRIIYIQKQRFTSLAICSKLPIRLHTSTANYWTSTMTGRHRHFLSKIRLFRKYPKTTVFYTLTAYQLGRYQLEA